MHGGDTSRTFVQRFRANFERPRETLNVSILNDSRTWFSRAISAASVRTLLFTRLIRTNRAHNLDSWHRATHFIPQRILSRDPMNHSRQHPTILSDRSIADLSRATIGCAHVREKSRKSHPRRTRGGKREVTKFEDRHRRSRTSDLGARARGIR